MNTDPAIVRVLATFGIDADAPLGQGGEAIVYALDARHVIRINHAGTNPAVVANRSVLLAELAQSAARVPFAIPSVVATRVVAERIVTVETRLPGRPLSVVLKEVQGEARAALVRAYLDAAARIGDLTIHRPWYGDLLVEQPIRTHTFRAYLEQRARRSLAAAGGAFATVDAGELASALPEPAEPTLVHLDAFPGNVLSDGAASLRCSTSARWLSQVTDGSTHSRQPSILMLRPRQRRPIRIVPLPSPGLLSTTWRRWNSRRGVGLRHSGRSHSTTNRSISGAAASCLGDRQWCV